MGRHSVKAAWVKLRAKRPVVVRTEMLRLPPDSGDNKDIIESWIQKVGLSKARCVIGVPGQYAMFQPFTLAMNDQRTLDQVAAMEVLQFNDMASETMAYNFAPLEINEGERRMILAMARPTILEDSLDTAAEIGVQTINEVPSPLAVFNFFETFGEEHKSPCLYVNIGHSSTEVAVGSRMGLMFARAFLSGGQMFTESLARALGISSSQAESVKVKDGRLIPEDERNAPLRASADLWLTELASCMSVYKSLYQEPRLQPTKIVLSGNGAELEGMPEYVGEKMGLQTVPASSVVGSTATEEPGLFATAIGLAISGFDAAPVRISLLPPRVRDELEFRRQKPFWISSGIAAALIFAVSLAGGFRDFKRKEEHLNAQKTSLSHRQQLVTQIEAVKKGTDHMIEMAKPVDRMVRNGPLLRDIIAVISGSIGERDWISMVCDSDSYFWYEPFSPETPSTKRRGMRDHRRKKSKLPGKGEDPTRPNMIIVEGFTRSPDLKTVKSLIAQLSAQDYIEAADLLSDDLEVRSPFDKDSDRFNAVKFLIEIKLAEL